MAVRMAISLASRSRCPSRSRSCSTCPMSRSISFSVSRRNSSAVALTAFAIIHGNEAPAKIAEILDLTEQLFPAQLQIAQWLVHSASYLNVCTHSDYRAKKEKTQLPPTKLAHTLQDRLVGRNPA